ncbi:MAG: helix-turn-helix transcriptional regulator [Saprospiraceae bacterium]|nr:helix-turn-helix transcriptional regulator [Saprospiraceae bacterium]
MTKFATNLVLLRHFHKVSHLDLASLLGVSINEIKKYENSITEPDLEGLLRMGKLFEIPLQTLITNDLRTDYRLVIRKDSSGSIPTHSVMATTLNRLAQVTIFCARIVEELALIDKSLKAFDSDVEGREMNKVVVAMKSLISVISLLYHFFKAPSVIEI